MVELVNKDFEGYPAFPADVPQVPLFRLSLQKLVENDSDEVDRLWEACTGLGFFYLDLCSGATQAITNGQAKQDGAFRPVDGARFNRDAADLFHVVDGLFDLPIDEKLKSNFRDGDGTYPHQFGYKIKGALYADATGAKDSCESYNVRPRKYLS